MKKPKTALERAHAIDVLVLRDLKRHGPATVGALVIRIGPDLLKLLPPKPNVHRALKASLNALECKGKAIAKEDRSGFWIWYAVEVAKEAIRGEEDIRPDREATPKDARKRDRGCTPKSEIPIWTQLPPIHVGGVQVKVTIPGEGTDTTTVADTVTRLHIIPHVSAFSSKIELADKLVVLADMIRASTTDFDGGSADVFVLRRYSTEALSRLRRGA